MRSYRESFSTEGGRRGLTQEALLERMGSGDSDYAERYSHATVSRWESGGTRPTLLDAAASFRGSLKDVPNHIQYQVCSPHHRVR